MPNFSIECPGKQVNITTNEVNKAMRLLHPTVEFLVKKVEAETKSAPAANISQLYRSKPASDAPVHGNFGSE